MLSIYQVRLRTMAVVETVVEVAGTDEASARQAARKIALAVPDKDWHVNLVEQAASEVIELQKDYTFEAKSS